jgi:SEC-C motif-containing protein
VRAECPCGRPGTFGGVLPYDRCCGRYLDDAGTPAPDAVSLMRSRYTAYAIGRADYLLATWDPATRPARLRLDPELRWTGLEILDRREPGDDARARTGTGSGTAEVEFIARFRQAGEREGQVHERSRFDRHGGRWYYRDGDLR